MQGEQQSRALVKMLRGAVGTRWLSHHGFQSRLQVFHCSTTTTTPSWHTRWVLWRQKPLVQRVGFFVRIIRIPTIAAGIFSLGYHQGVIESQQHPEQFQEQLMASVLQDAAAATSDYEVLSARDVSGLSKRRLVKSSRNHQVAHVAQQLVEVGMQHIAMELEKAYKSDNKKDIELWEAARLRFAGRPEKLNDNGTWKFVFVDSPVPNAWVTELLPRKIFITTALLNMAETIDEIAFVLGHELSHLILGHLSRGNGLKTSLKTVEIVLLSLDPTEGILSVAVVALLDLFRRGVEASYSRDHESEADDLGLRLVAACKRFDVEAGSRLMYRLHCSVSTYSS